MMFRVRFAFDFFFFDAMSSRKQPEETKIFETGYQFRPKNLSDFLCDNSRRIVQLKEVKC